jgi:hypothetical protein
VGAGGDLGPILVFPGGMPRSLEFLAQCRAQGRDVIGASSLAYDVAIQEYPRWLFLPYVTDPGFTERLREVMEREGIASIFTPNPVVWKLLERVLPEIAPQVSLLNDSPLATELARYRSARHRAASWQGVNLFAAADYCRPELTQGELAATIAHADAIPGMCDYEKFLALYHVCRCAPEGDIVEIGTWWGKSAFVLSRLAACYRLGRLLCVDPWSDADLAQGDESGLVDSSSATADAQEAFEVFAMNLGPYCRGDINYLRLRSAAALERYGQGRIVNSEEFGQTEYCGQISLLHVDGNHGYSAVSADLEGWAPLVMPGGWIVIDDYLWPYGDGPHRAANQFLAGQRKRISTAFVMGGALFVRLAS